MTDTLVYDVLLKQQRYNPAEEYIGESKYICVFYDESKKLALSEMQKYVKQHGFSTPDEQETVSNVVLRTRTATGKFISETPYCELFDTATDKILPEAKKSAEADEATSAE